MCAGGLLDDIWPSLFHLVVLLHLGLSLPPRKIHSPLPLSSDRMTSNLAPFKEVEGIVSCAELVGCMRSWSGDKRGRNGPCPFRQGQKRKKKKKRIGNRFSYSSAIFEGFLGVLVG